MASGTREALIRKLAAQRGLDPNAVIADSLGEGAAALHGGNSVGDHGTSFGPFQLHAGGALPASVWRRGAAFANRWANSRAGIEYALDGMVRAGAAGQTGAQAVSTIVSKFERPADIPGETQRRIGFLKGGQVDAAWGTPGDNKSTPGRPGSGGLWMTPNPKAVVVQTLLQGASDAAKGKQPDFGGILALAQLRQQQQAAQATYNEGATGALHVPTGKAAKGGVHFVGSLNGEDPDFVNKVSAAAKAAGATQIRVNSGYRDPAHNKAVGGASNSNHLTGHALDGEGYVPGKGWVPLGTLVAPVASKFGLRSGATFNWNGKPDVVHVDDATNIRT